MSDDNEPPALHAPMPFIKVFGQKALTSSLMAESDGVFRLFFCMLFSTDANGFVDIPNTKILAMRFGMTVEAVEAALRVLEAPDDGSRSPDHEGRRVLRIESPTRGWMVVNAKSYRLLQTHHQRKDSDRKKRERTKRAATVAKRKATREANMRQREESDAFDRTHGVGGASWDKPSGGG